MDACLSVGWTAQQVLWVTTDIATLSCHSQCIALLPVSTCKLPIAPAAWHCIRSAYAEVACDSKFSTWINNAACKTWDYKHAPPSQHMSAKHAAYASTDLPKQIWGETLACPTALYDGALCNGCSSVWLTDTACYILCCAKM